MDGGIAYLSGSLGGFMTIRLGLQLWKIPSTVLCYLISFGVNTPYGQKLQKLVGEIFYLAVLGCVQWSSGSLGSWADSPKSKSLKTI